MLVGATALSLTSCNDFLDRDPLGQFTEDDSPNALVGGKIFNVYYLMRSYDITAGIPAFMVHMVRSEDSEKGSDAGDGSNEAAMWDDFEYTAPTGRSAPIGDRTTKSSTSATKSWTTLRRADTRTTPKHPQPRRSALLPCLVLLQPGTRLWRSAAGHHQGSGSLRCQRAQDHGGKDIRTD